MEDAVIDIRNAKGEEQLKELASLARLIAFARENARELNAEFPAHCLDMALNALLQESRPSGDRRPFIRQWLMAEYEYTEVAVRPGTGKLRTIFHLLYNI